MSQASKAEPAAISGPAFERLRAKLKSVLAPGIIGNFDHIELFEVFAIPPKSKPLNVLSVAVLAEGRPDIGDLEHSERLISKLISKIDGFKDWSFGVQLTRRPLAALDQSLAAYAATTEWSLSGQHVRTGVLEPVGAMFAPPDGSATVPLNRVLKNNFWAGSHVFRLTDREKTQFQPFFDDRRRLQALSDAVSAGVPMAFAGLADLLGDVLIQVPVTILVPSVTAPRNAEYSDVTVTWRPGSAPRALTIAGRTRWDEMLSGAAVSTHFDNEARLPIDNHRHALETEIVDAEAGILVGATSWTSTLKRIVLDMHMIQHEPRVFSIPNPSGEMIPERVRLTETSTSIVGDDPGQDANFWRERRQDLEERRRLDETRDFVQYRPGADPAAEQTRAIADLRFLINTHGEEGADLWDPYLTAKDLLRTLFWCSHSGAPLRALTDGQDPVDSDLKDQPASGATMEPELPFSDRQKTTLERHSGNREGLRLEYRTRRGPKGWRFHDRFLIFPNARRGPQAWSLGTSVNSLGKAHHILQRVSNPAMIAGAFKDLWDELDEPQHLVWRSW